jgi:NADH dehydrogenase
MSDASKRVLLTGATGFVGRNVLRQLVATGHVPVCVVRDPARLEPLTRDLTAAEIVAVSGDVVSGRGLKEAAEQSGAAIHLVGIIVERKDQTFSAVHHQGTRNVVQACVDAGIKRFIQMSALGVRADAVSKYHQTKYAGDQQVMRSGLDWTVMRPSIVHGADSEFMELMRTFACSLLPPFMPYFGSGENRLQPVDVRDVAECFVRALSCDAAIHRSYDLGGPRSYSWKELYRLCRRIIPNAKSWKPMIGQPVILAKLMAGTIMKLPAPTAKIEKLRFDAGQVAMSQEDNTCNIAAAEQIFDITFRDFETEMKQYADQIR